jgi:hypothetical protein
VAAGIAAFDRTPEGRARKRIMELEDKKRESLLDPSRDTLFRLSPEDQRELDFLQSLYPDLPPDPNDRMYGILMQLQKDVASEARELEAQKRGQDDTRD